LEKERFQKLQDTREREQWEIEKEKIAKFMFSLPETGPLNLNSE